MASKKRKRVAAAMLSALLAAAGALGLLKTAPKAPVPNASDTAIYHGDSGSVYGVTSPQARGFGKPCDTSDMVMTKFFGLGKHLWNKGALLPLKAAQKMAVVKSDYRPPVFSGSYVCRTIRGTTNRYSHHAWGLAVDFDAPNNCLGCPPESTTIAKEPEFVRAFLKFGFVWGGVWSRPDAMHFEYDGPYVPPRNDVHPGDKGPKVKALCSLLQKFDLPCKASDGYNGKDILSVVSFQKKNGLLGIEKAGTVGPGTWTLLVQEANRMG